MNDKLYSILRGSLPDDRSSIELDWWQMKEKRFRTIWELVQDVIAVQILFVASKSSFSEAGNLVSEFRSSLNGDITLAYIRMRPVDKIL